MQKYSIMNETHVIEYIELIFLTVHKLVM